MSEPQSRNEAILQATIDGVEYTAPPQSRIEALLLELKQAIEAGGGSVLVDDEMSETSLHPVQNKVITAALSDKADKVSEAVDGNFAGLDANGNLTDSGKKAADFLTSSDITGKQNVTLETPLTIGGVVQTTVEEALGALNSNISGNHIYSTTEQVVGTWIDGSPIYERTISAGSLPDKSTSAVATISDLGYLIDIEGFAYSTTSPGNIRPLSFVGGSDPNNNIRVDVSDYVLRIITYNSTWTQYNAYLTIRYTKATV